MVARQLMTTIVHPRIKSAKDMSGTVMDYITVPAITVRGTWSIVECMSDESKINALRAWQRAEKNESQAPRGSHVSRPTASRNRAHSVARRQKAS